jgi:steroid delta-isomerase-like uncharacterized protein
VSSINPLGKAGGRSREVVSEENKALARRWADIMTQGDLDLADEIYAPDYVDHDPTMPEDVRGVEGAREFYSMYRSAFPDAEITIEDQLAEEDTVATRWTGRGTHQGDLMGVPPSGNRVEVIGVTISRIEGGKIVEEWDIYDALGMMQAIGAFSEQ